MDGSTFFCCVYLHRVVRQKLRPSRIREKTMRKNMMFLLFVSIVSVSTIAQTKISSKNQNITSQFNAYKDYFARYTYKDGLLVLTFENGYNALRDIRFKLDEKTYNDIKESKVFKVWCNEQDSLIKTGIDSEYYEKKKNWDKVIFFIEKNIRFVIEFSVKWDMKERYSYDLIEESYNSIYVKDGETNVSCYYKSQTATGSYKIGCTYITIKVENGKVKSTYL